MRSYQNIVNTNSYHPFDLVEDNCVSELLRLDEILFAAQDAGSHVTVHRINTSREAGVY